jgi:small-conductance mechanosensitive channel
VRLLAFSFYDLPLWAWLLLLVAGALAVAWLAQRAILGTLRSFAKKTRTQVDDVILRAIGPSLTIAFFVAGVWLGLRVLPIVFSDFTNDTIDNVSFTLVVLAVAMALARLSGGLLAIPAKREPRWQSLSTIGKRLIYIVIYVMAFLTILPHYGLNVTPLVASLGIAGLAVALGLSDTLANFFAGLWIQAGRTLSRGHLVEFDDPKVLGFVQEIGWRTTKIQTLPNNVVVIPNQAVARTTITDYDLPEPRMGANMVVRAGFEADPERVERILIESVLAVARDSPSLGILADPPPSSRLNGFADQGFEFWLGFQCRDWFAQHNGAGAIRKEIVRRFREEGIRMPYPMNEQYAVPANRIDIARGITSAEYVPGGEQAPRPAAEPAAARQDAGVEESSSG